MKCYICGEEASGICAFCSVALCEEHMKREEKVASARSIRGFGSKQSWIKFSSKLVQTPKRMM
jgi:hypothetical protein